MNSPKHLLVLGAAVGVLGTGVFGQAPNGYDQLVAVHEQFLKLREPQVTDGVPDYTPAAIDAQKRGLAAHAAESDSAGIS